MAYAPISMAVTVFADAAAPQAFENQGAGLHPRARCPVRVQCVPEVEQDFEKR